jgi:putative nucleotidyltransferase with HDIG domain
VPAFRYASASTEAPLEGDDGAVDRITLLGEFQGFTGRSLGTVILPQPIQVWAIALGATAILLATGLALSGSGLNSPIWVLAGLAVLATCAETRSVRLTANTEVCVSALPILFCAVAFGPLAAMAVGAAGVLLDLRPPYTRWLTWTGMRALEAGLAGCAAWAILNDSRSLGRLIGAVAAAALVGAVVDASLAAITVRLRGTGSCLEFLRTVRPVLVATVPAYTPFVVILVYAYREISPWTLILFLAPAFAAHNLYKLYREQRESTDNLTEANARLERANLSFAEALIAALDARDRYTAGHSAAVAIYAREIAAHLGLSRSEQERAHLCGLVHDIGKVGLPPGILEKAGPLTSDERQLMEQHSIIGERILANVEDYSDVALVVRHHHERIDGSGYPDNLPGVRIPLLSRILAVADAYDAMTSARPYRDAMPTAVARERLIEGAGTQFDPLVVEAFQATRLKDPELRSAQGSRRPAHLVDHPPRLALVEAS